METVLVTGYSKAPQGTAMYEKNKYTGIVLEIHKKSEIIVNVEFTFVTGLAQDFFRRLVVGYDLKRGIEPLIDKIKKHYFAPSQQSVIVALKVAFQRYQSSLSEMMEESQESE
jgi:hypothetical protein